MISLIKQQFDEKCRMKVTPVSVCKVSELQECQLTKMSTSESWSLNDYQSYCKNLSISNFFSSGRRKAKQAQQESSMEELRVGKLLKILAIRISSGWKYMKSLILIFINSVVHMCFHKLSADFIFYLVTSDSSSQGIFLLRIDYYII